MLQRLFNMNLFPILITTFLLFSCISEREKESDRERTPATGDNVKVSNIDSVSPEFNGIKYKKIEVSNFKLLENIEPEISASKYALDCFNNLEKEERDFDKVEVVLNQSSGEIITFEISKNKLELINSEIQFINKWIAEVKNKKIEESYNYLDEESPLITDFDEYNGAFEELKEQYGPLESAYLNGFSLEEVEEDAIQGEIHQFIYTFKGKNGNYTIPILLSPSESNYKIYGLFLDN